MTARKVIQLSIDGSSPIKVWSSAESASAELGIPATNIIKCAKGKRYHAGGYMWKYDQETESQHSDNQAVGNKSSIVIPEQFERSFEVDVNNGTLKSSVVLSFDAKSPDELYDLHKVDRKTYKISNYWSKLRPDGKFTSSILATIKKTDDITPEDILSILNYYKSTYRPIKSQYHPKTGNECCAFIDITDFHLDKRELAETKPEDKKALFLTVLRNLLDKSCVSYNVKKIAFIVGSDMLHTDNILGQTTKGTPQEYTLRWDESFEMAFDIYNESIQMMKEYCPIIDIILVLSNHSRTKEYYLASALQKYFENDDNISFDITPLPRKIFTYGCTFIGLHHGNTKLESLPLVFSREFGFQWGSCKFHEIKVGDKHHYMEKDYHGVLIKQLPALTGEDTWHNDNNYVCQVKGAVSTIYDITKGRVADIHERI